MMWSLVLTAVLFLTGTQARFLWQNEEPQSPADRAQELIHNYVKQALELGKEAVSQVENSEYGKKLDIKLSEKLDAFSANAQILHKQLGPYIEQARQQVATEYERDLEVAKEKLQPILLTFQHKWDTEVKAFEKKFTPLAEDLHKHAKDTVESWSKKLLPIAEELRDTLRTQVEKLRTSIAPISDDVREQAAKKLEELRAKANPYAEEYRAQLSAQIEALHEKYGPVAQELKERLIPHAEVVRSKLNSWYDIFKAQLAQAA